MFGYVRILKDELKIKEYNAFRSYYCGLCKALKTEYGFTSSMALNYDSVFLALLLTAVTDDPITCSQECCIANPVKKRPIAKCDRIMSYCAGVMLILTFLKLEDNIRDEKSIKAILASLGLWRVRRKLMKKHKDLYLACKEHIQQLSSLERENCPSVDKAAHCFASVTEKVFVPPFIKEESTKRILAHMGYLIGRFIYMLDAYEDRENDAKHKNYNPYLLSGDIPDKDAFSDSMTFSLSILANDYELLDIKRNKSILDNILYLGLPHTLHCVANGISATNKGDRKHEGSL